MLLWDAVHVDCELLFDHAKTDTIDRYCSVKVTPVRYKIFSFIFHGVYGDPDGLDLSRLELMEEDSWLMMGDYNLTHKTERNIKSPNEKREMAALEKLTSSSGIHDLSFDPMHTHGDSKTPRRLSKLDRIVCTSTFYNSFRSIKPMALGSTLSDHQPVYLSLGHPIL